MLARLPNEPPARAVPVGMVNADATPDQVSSPCAARATDYLAKPLDVAAAAVAAGLLAAGAGLMSQALRVAVARR